MIGINDLPSFDTLKGKMFWCGFFAFMITAIIAETIIDPFIPRAGEVPNG